MKLSMDQDLVTLETLAEVIAHSQIMLKCRPARRHVCRRDSTLLTLPSLTGSLPRDGVLAAASFGCNWPVQRDRAGYWAAVDRPTVLPGKPAASK